AALAAALRSSAAFEVVAVAAAIEDVARGAEVVLVARTEHAEELVGAGLTNREREILGLLAEGLGNKQIAARLGISTHTVKTHLELLFDKLGVSSRAEAVAVGVRRGLLLL